MNKINTFARLGSQELIDTYDVDNVDAYKHIASIYGDEWLNKLKEYIYSEHVLSVVYKIKGEMEFNISDIEAVLSGIGESFIPYSNIYLFKNISENERLIMKTYWYFRSYSSKVNNMDLIRMYLDNNFKSYKKSLKLFKMNDDNKIVPNVAKISSKSTYKKYIELSTIPMPLESFNTLIQYDDNREDGILNKYIYKSIEDSRLKEECDIKKYEEINEILNSVDIYEKAKAMDDLIIKNTSKKSSHYRETIEKIEILKYDGKNITSTNKHLLELQGIYTHLAGKTGAGKSVQLDMLLKILSDNGKRVLVVTPNHASSFKMKKTCTDLDIPNVMLMGRNREEYMNNFFEGLYIEEIQKSNMYSGREINYSKALSFLKENDKYFRDMSNGCNDRTAKTDYEKSTGIRYTEEKYFHKPCANCSLIKGCSFARPYREAFSDMTNVIIAPIQTLLKTKLMGGLDRERRTLWESLMLTIDLIIIDEVDEIQAIAEGVHAYKDIIYSNDSQINASKIEGSLEYYRDELNKISRKNIAENYSSINRKLNDLDMLINFIGKYYLSNKTISFVENEIKFSTSFDEDSLVYDYFGKYYYKSKKDKEVLADTVKKFLNILRTDDFKNFLNGKISKLLDKYTNNEDNIDDYMITETEDKTIASRFSEVYDAFYTNFNNLIVKYKIPQIDNKGKANKKNNKDMIKHLMFIFLIIKLKNDYNAFTKEVELKIDISRKKNSSTSVLPSLTKSLLDSAICGFVIDSDNIEVPGKNGIVEIKKAGKLKIFKYEGIGREVLLNTNKYLSVLYGIQAVPMFICSATSGDTKSSLHTVKYPVNLVLQNSDQLKDDNIKDYLKLYCHVFKHNGKPCKTSGDFTNRIKNTQDTCKAMKKFIKDLVDEQRSKNEGVLIVSPSSVISYEIYDTFKYMFPEMNIKVLYTSSHDKEFDISMHIDRNSVEQCASKKVDILIAVNQTIARGFNILKDVDGETNKSYFTDIIMFNRFLPSPEDYLTHISFAHILLEKVLKDNKLKMEDFGTRYKETVNNANKILKRVKHIEGFSQLPNELKEMIIGNIYCLLSQIKGRGQRGGSNCRIHLIDASCYPNTAELMINNQLSEFTIASSKFRALSEAESAYDDKDSMMQGIIYILNNGDELSKILFDEMKEAFNNHIFINH